MTETGKQAFYVLAALVLVTMASVLAANMGLLGEGPIVSNFAKWGLAGVLAEIVALFGLVVRAAIKPRSFALVVELPAEMREVDITRLTWDPERCVVLYARRTKRMKVRPVLSSVGRAFEIRMGAEILEQTGDTDTVELELIDGKGLRWEVKPFFVFYRYDKLSCIDSPHRVKELYSAA